uniref:Nudix hydrolase domain-containing protein n=1 Tax=Zea mays TaxID=4577 RepID=A0A804PX65_MAIZE
MTMAGGGGLNRSSSRGQLPPQELLDDLCSRFLLNVPKEELESFERILFLLEQAHWFYEDNSVEHNPNLKSLSFKDFTSLMFKSCTALRPYIAHLDDIYKDFNNYKFRVPVSGAIILDDTYERCLLVKGWKAGASWSFPRGKRNKDEEDHTCAVREVLEETGCDVSRLLNLDDYIEVSIGQQRVRLYIITGVKRDTVFAPQTKKEISEISWHRIDDLLPASDDAVSRAVNGMKLYMVAPFLTGLKAWIATHPPPLHQKPETSARGFFFSPSPILPEAVTFIWLLCRGRQVLCGGRRVRRAAQPQWRILLLKQDLTCSTLPTALVAASETSGLTPQASCRPWRLPSYAPRILTKHQHLHP